MNTTRIRREPPHFRRVEVRRVAPVSSRLLRVTLAGPEFEGFAVADPAASVRLLIPSVGRRQLVMPTWNGNEFLLADGRRPAIRTFTPRRFDPVALELDLDVVLHGHGAAAEWAGAADAGAECAISGPGRGYAIDENARSFLLAGDETAIPAISQLTEAIPAGALVRIHLEVAQPDGRVALPSHPRAEVDWHDLPDGARAGDTLVAAVEASDLAGDERVWVAGEAAAVQRIRRHLFEERTLPRAQATVRGYWKFGRAGAGDDS